MYFLTLTSCYELGFRATITICIFSVQGLLAKDRLASTENAIGKFDHSHEHDTHERYTTNAIGREGLVLYGCDPCMLPVLLCWFGWMIVLYDLSACWMGWCWMLSGLKPVSRFLYFT